MVRRRAVAHCAAGLASLLVLLGLGSAAHAKTTKVLDYRFDAIWSTAVRLLRVDRGYKITDRDRANGYLMFVFPGSGAVKQCAASLEIVSVVDELGYRRHRLQLAIAHQPSYIELHLLEALERKLRDEHGEPPPPKRRPDDDEGKKKGNGKKGDEGKPPRSRDG